MKTAVAALVAVATAVVTAVFLDFVGHGLNPLTAWLSLAVGTGLGILQRLEISKLDGTGVGFLGTTHFYPRGREVWLGWKNWTVIEWATVLSFALFAWRAFSWVAYESGGNISFLSPLNFGDLSLHLTYINYFANGAPFWPANPIFAYEPLNYPVGVDLFTSLLVLVGADVLRTFVWLGFLSCIATGIALWRWGGAFTLAGFLFIGGTAGFAFFKTWEVRDYLNEVDWKSIPQALFVTQRSLLYALPAGLVLLTAWRSRLVNGKAILPLSVEVLLYASMPVFHVHTFLFLSFLLGVWAIVLPTRRQVIQIIALAFLPATSLVWLVTGGVGTGAGMIHWKPGWLQGNENPFVYWITNFGFLPFCTALLIGSLGWDLFHRESTSEERSTAFKEAAFVLPATLLFLATCFISFAPWAWDNTKLMVWCVLALLPSIWLLIHKFPLFLRVPICFGLFFSGFISLYGGLDRSHTGYNLISIEEMAAVRQGVRDLPITATFAATPTFDNPILLAGRKTTCGYDGHLMSHGIDYRDVKGAVEDLLDGPPHWKQLIQDLQVDYIYWGTKEEEKFRDSRRPWVAAAPIVFQNKWATVYDVRSFKN